MTDKSLESDNVSFAFGMAKPVIAGFSQSFYFSGVTPVRGANGTGKSTLLKLAAGLYLPLRGAIHRHCAVSYLGDQSGLYLDLSLEEQADIFLTGKPGLSHAFERWQCDRYRKKKVRELSRGQRRRAALAMTECENRPLVLLDEPGSYLDQTGVETLLAWVEEQSNAGKSFIISTHDESFRGLINRSEQAELTLR